MRHVFQIAVFLFFVAAGCTTEKDVQVDASSKIPVGITKDQVAKRLGAPSAKQDWTKKAEPIFGVIETWWDQLKDGDRIEIWDYVQDKGTFSVYFLNGGEKVWHTSFVRKGVVF